MAGQEPQDDQPQCFGVLDAVFPPGPDGLREVSEDCWPCARRVECLRVAATSESGARTLSRERGRPQPARPAPSGHSGPDDSAGKVGGFLRRWSRLKAQSREGGEG